MPVDNGPAPKHEANSLKLSEGRSRKFQKGVNGLVGHRRTIPQLVAARRRTLSIVCLKSRAAKPERANKDPHRETHHRKVPPNRSLTAGKKKRGKKGYGGEKFEQWACSRMDYRLTYATLSHKRRLYKILRTQRVRSGHLTGSLLTRQGFFVFWRWRRKKELSPPLDCFI